jgi:hypothetical protein
LGKQGEASGCGFQGRNNSHPFGADVSISLCNRYLRTREDKKAEGATTAEQIVELYFSQGDLGDGGAGGDGDDEDDGFI